jgi:hypothetical protein
LEKSIQEVENIVIPEVKNGIALWKERVNMSSLIVLGSIAALLVLAEVQLGIVIDSLMDPISGSIIALVIIAIMIPTHLIMGRIQAKFIINRL